MQDPSQDRGMPPGHHDAAPSAGPRYLPLRELGIEFVPFPDVPTKAVAQAVANTPGGRGRSPATERLPPGRRGVFVGQLPLGLSPERLAFAVNTVLGREAVRMVSVAHRQSCGWVCLDDDTADEAFARSESALVEGTGVWVARDATQHRQLNDFCAALKARRYGEEILKLQLPKATLTLKPTTASSGGSARGGGGRNRDGNISRAAAPQQRHQQQQQPLPHEQLPGAGLSPWPAAAHVAPPGQQQHAHQQQMVMVPAGPPDAYGRQPMMFVPVIPQHHQQQRASQGVPTSFLAFEHHSHNHHHHHQYHHHLEQHHYIPIPAAAHAPPVAFANATQQQTQPNTLPFAGAAPGP